jgi:hypothetical protein
VEIDASPDRQDLDIELLRSAREAGVLVSIGSDAHNPGELKFMEFGLAAAIQAGIPKERILNFWSAAEVMEWAGPNGLPSHLDHAGVDLPEPRGSNRCAVRLHTRRSGMKRAICGAVLCLLFATPAWAATQDDPDDVSGRLDLRQVTRTFSNSPSAPPMVHLQATTFDRWTLDQCRRADACSFAFELDSRGGPGADVLAFWDVDPDGPSCVVFNARTGNVLTAGDAEKFRRSAFCSFPKRLLQQDKPVRWRVSSVWGTVQDNAPDQGWY